MKTVRKGVFETNSSSCHCVTVLSKDELQNFAKNRWYDCIYLPDTGDYCTGSEYKIMSKEAARLQYNHDHILANEHSLKHGSAFITPVYQNDEYIQKDDEYWQDKFEDDLEKGMLYGDSGKYLTFEQLMSCAVIEGDIKFDISWWNDD